MFGFYFWILFLPCYLLYLINVFTSTNKYFQQINYQFITTVLFKIIIDDASELLEMFN